MGTNYPPFPAFQNVPPAPAAEAIQPENGQKQHGSWKRSVKETTKQSIYNVVNNELVHNQEVNTIRKKDEVVKIIGSSQESSQESLSARNDNLAADTSPNPQ